MGVDLTVRDIAPAAVLASYGAFEVLSGVAPGVGEVPGDARVSAAGALVAGGAVALRRAHPVAGLGLVALAAVAETALTTPAEGLAPMIAAMWLLFALAASRGRAIAAAALVTTVLSQGIAFGDVVFLAVVYAVPWLGGRVAGDRRRQLAELHVASVDDTSRAVQAERDRIARDLHDIVSHALSLVVVQSQVAQAHVRDDPDAAERALVAVKEAGQEALADMRRLLGVLREAPDTAALGPQPGLDQLPTLVERVRAAGLDVEVAETGSPRQLPPGASLTAYRVVQEALTNALRHATSAHVAVSLAWTPSAVAVAVRDDGGGHRDEPSAGRGLIGLRERVALYGGSFRAGPRAGGGFEVEAVLPA